MSSTNYSSPNPEKSVSFKRISTLNSPKYRTELSPVEVVHENFELRERLRELNLKLNELLETRPGKTKRVGKMSSPRSILSIAEKQLRHYE